MALIIKSNTEHISTEEHINNLSIDILINSKNVYPYCAVTQFMLAKKLHQQNDVHFSKQVQQTATHFNNTNWLDYQLIYEEKNVFSSVKSNLHHQTLIEATLTTDDFVSEKVVENEVQIESIPTTEKNVPEANTPDNTASITSFALAASEENIDLKIASSMEKQLSDFNKPIDENTELIIATEPYHTVDYFASQGIKVEIDPNAQDKLTKQVRKFTDWLKQMKTITATETAVFDTELENEIQLIANDSNETKEVVTETMAEVFEKQGKFSKAIVLYEKLSFLNPDKSTYFANKIQQLKNK
jgi:hypothetical protein